MTIKDLRDIVDDRIKRRSHSESQIISGCELLEYIDDIPGFVSLLDGFRRIGTFNVNFVNDFPDPIGTILHENVEFYTTLGVVIVRIEIDKNNSFASDILRNEFTYNGDKGIVMSNVGGSWSIRMRLYYEGSYEGIGQ